MMNTWAPPPRFQARSEAINPEFWPAFWIIGPVASCSHARSPCFRVPDGQAAVLQTGLSREAL
jgi:hypothetical protein